MMAPAAAGRTCPDHEHDVGRAPSVAHTLELRLASRTKAPAAPSREPSDPARPADGAEPAAGHSAGRQAGQGDATDCRTGYEKPKGRMLIYWGCGEHVGGRPADRHRLRQDGRGPGAAGHGGDAPMRRAWRIAAAAARRAMASGRTQGQPPGAGERLAARRAQDRGQLFAADRLHAAGRTSCPRSACAKPAPCRRARPGSAGRPAPTATGYALTMFGGAAERRRDHLDLVQERGDGADLDYLPPAEVKRLVGTGAVLPPTTNQCLLPAEVATASPSRHDHGDRLRSRSAFRRSAQGAEMDGQGCATRRPPR